ncbi:zinc finger protein 708-like [Spodoptera litura]|uniref:Zinc finger protein 708-like n=1 Tax=Spodoptera litura TaxID=69820 RepID=A0A9J7IGA9_SPOLT|nr:zinc finger protein 708-like [Spodoptera litura]
MNPTTSYCRLCAELKLRDKLVNLQIDKELCQKVINKLSRFHITIDFQDNVLPKTVCLLCIKSLEQAFKFICAVNEAQAFLSDFVMVKCTERDLVDNVVSCELVDCVPKPLDSAQDPMEIGVEDSFTNDQVKCENNSSSDDCNFYEDKGFDSVMIKTYLKIDPTVSEPVHIEPNKPMFNILDNFANNTNSTTTLHEDKDTKNYDDHVICQVVKIENFDSQCSEMIEEKHSTIQGKKSKKIKTKISPRKSTEVNSGANTETYSENDVNELIENLGYVPEQYITKTWQDYLWQCSHCETQFTTMENLQKHSMEFHNSCNSYKCADCTTRSSNLKFFLKHVRKHHKYLHYSCYKCYRIFPNVADTGKHKARIHKYRNMCLGCHNSFPTKEQLKEHTEKYYKKLFDSKKYNNLRTDNSTCRICHKHFNSYSSYKHHFITQHTEGSNNVCDICGKSFKSKSVFNNHVAIHKNRDTFQCEICKLHLKSRHGLRYHMELHTGIKPFACDICGKRFRAKSQIRNHLIIHTDQFPYACTVCDKKFRNNSNRKNHMLQHSGAKPHSCNICFRDFANLANRNKHVRRKHGVELAKRRRHETNQVKVTRETPEAQNIQNQIDDIHRNDLSEP